jgi:membrane-bound lytic murein transglycosylase B
MTMDLRPSLLTRRQCLPMLLGACTALAFSSLSAQSRTPFPEWVRRFRAKAQARGISDATYDRVMAHLKPDTRVYAFDRQQPEFTEDLWQYLNRRVSEWRIDIGRQRAQEHGGLLARIERDTGVNRYLLLGLWGMESAYGNLIDDKKYMRPVFPALAALAWGEPRRRRYWERELLNALVIVERGWAKPVRESGRRARRHGEVSGQARTLSRGRNVGVRGSPSAQVQRAFGGPPHLAQLSPLA